MKVLIIGIGNIGKSHLQSFLFSKKKYTIYLYDKNKNTDSSVKTLDTKNTKIINLKKFPTSLKFDLAIVSTNSLERFVIIKKLINYNKVKFLILEKFIFTKDIHYKKAKFFLKRRSSKLFINVWGGLIAHLLKIKIDKRKKIFFDVKIREGRMITNAIHYLDLFGFLTIKEIDISVFVKKVIKSKRKKYSEILGQILGSNKIGKIKITSQKNLTDKITIYNGDNKYLIKIAYKNKCYLYKNSEFIRAIDFPFSYIYTRKIFENYFLNNKNRQVFSNFDFVYDTSDKIVQLLKKDNKQIYIT
jgi:hypothetical protein